MPDSQVLSKDAPHPLSLTGFADRAYNYASDAFISAGWRPLLGLAENAAVSYVTRWCWSVGCLRTCIQDDAED